jgi:hypothetical protein
LLWQAGHIDGSRIVLARPRQGLKAGVRLVRTCRLLSSLGIARRRGLSPGIERFGID